MKRAILILAVLAGAVLAFVMCGGVEFAGQVRAAMNANAPALAEVAE